MSILPLPDKIEALMKPKPSTTVKEVRHFLGLMGYYHKFIYNYIDIAYPLNCLYHSHSCGLQECQASFNMLQLRLTNTPIVHYLTQNKPYLLFTDVSNFLCRCAYSSIHCRLEWSTYEDTCRWDSTHKHWVTNTGPLTSIQCHPSCSIYNR